MYIGVCVYIISFLRTLYREKSATHILKYRGKLSPLRPRHKPRVLLPNDAIGPTKCHCKSYCPLEYTLIF